MSFLRIVLVLALLIVLTTLTTAQSNLQQNYLQVYEQALALGIQGQISEALASFRLALSKVSNPGERPQIIFCIDICEAAIDSTIENETAMNLFSAFSNIMRGNICPTVRQLELLANQNSHFLVRTALGYSYTMWANNRPEWKCYQTNGNWEFMNVGNRAEKRTELLNSACEQFKQAIAHKPDYGVSNYYLAIAQMYNGDYAEARKSCSAAAKAGLPCGEPILKILKEHIEGNLGEDDD
ncbi:MAG: hypothetical protein KKG33_05665 [candidate division Zixibacteria bacterium]|nr:hypothetical protein [candidate division Zixibacteria bacterium]